MRQVYSDESGTPWRMTTFLEMDRGMYSQLLYEMHKLVAQFTTWEQQDVDGRNINL